MFVIVVCSIFERTLFSYICVVWFIEFSLYVLLLLVVVVLYMCFHFVAGLPLDHGLA
jgi:hypothetical protein